VVTTACRASTASATAHDDRVFLYAFDLIELDGDDLRREMFETRKGDARLGAGRRRTIRFNRSLALIWTWQHSC
jgi:hypothetical protein